MKQKAYAKIYLRNPRNGAIVWDSPTVCMTEEEYKNELSQISQYKYSDGTDWYDNVYVKLRGDV